MRSVIAVVVALLIGWTGGLSTSAQDAPSMGEPAPVGNEVQLEPSNVTVTVVNVTTTETPAETFGGLAGDDLKPDRAGIAVEIEITNGEGEAFEPDGAIDFRLVEGSGKEHGTPLSISHCGDRETTWVWWGNIRPGRSATMTVCFVIPADQLDGTFMEVRWDDDGLFLPFSLDMSTAEATPVASPMSH